MSQRLVQNKTLLQACVTNHAAHKSKYPPPQSKNICFLLLGTRLGNSRPIEPEVKV